MKRTPDAKALISNESGIALITVILVMAVISILGISLLGLAAGNLKMSTGERDYQSSYYTAESGITFRLNDISAQLKTAYSAASSQTDFFNRVNAIMQLGQTITYNNKFESSFGQQPTSAVRIDSYQVPGTVLISYSNDYMITSTGTINNRSRTVTKIIHVTWKPKASVTIPGNTMVFVNNGITLNNVPVSGTIGTNLLSGDSNIKLTGTNTKNITVNYNLQTPLNIPAFPSFSLAANPDVLTGTALKMTRNMSFNTFTVNSGTTLTIDVGNVNRSIAINTLTCNGTIRIIGSGKLSIYVNYLSMGTGSVINSDGNIEKLYVFYKGLDTTVTLNNGIIYGAMYAIHVPTFTINSTNGVQGHLITDATSVMINGSAITTARLIYAPNADVFSNAGFIGSIIAKSFGSSGKDDSFKFQYVQINYDGSPLFVDNGTGNSPVQDLVTAEPTREAN
jgi:Tfp pilus assembly protein PilX